MTALLTTTNLSALAPVSSLIAWRPFLDPITLPDGAWWLTLVPLSLLISIVYKAVRVRTMDRYVINVIVMTVQIIVSMVLLSVGAHLFVLWIIPALAR